MPLVSGSAFVADAKSLEFLMQPNATTLKPPAGAPTSAQIGALVTKMQSVRKLNIAYVEFRGCSMGAEMKNLEVLREFLGCTSVSAPDVKSSWATVQPKIMKPADFDEWTKTTPGVQVGTSLPDVAVLRWTGVHSRHSLPLNPMPWSPYG